jgi:hypothetical protein
MLVSFGRENAILKYLIFTLIITAYLTFVNYNYVLLLKKVHENALAILVKKTISMQHVSKMLHVYVQKALI